MAFMLLLALVLLPELCVSMSFNKGQPLKSAGNQPPAILKGIAGLIRTIDPAADYTAGRTISREIDAGGKCKAFVRLSYWARLDDDDNKIAAGMSCTIAPSTSVSISGADLQSAYLRIFDAIAGKINNTDGITFLAAVDSVFGIDFYMEPGGNDSNNRRPEHIAGAGDRRLTSQTPTDYNWDSQDCWIYDSTLVNGDRLDESTRLDTGASLCSPNGKYKLTMLRSCNLALHDKLNNLLFQTQTGGKGSGCYLTLQVDGNLVIYDDSHKVVWAVNKFSNSPCNIASSFTLQNDGNVVLYRTDSQSIAFQTNM